MSDKNQAVKVEKKWEERSLITNWTKQSSAVFDLGGDKPIKGLLMNLTTSGAVTFKAQDEAGNEFSVLGSDGTELSITTASLTENYRFYPEFGPLRRVKAICATSQTGASIVGVFAS